jgi:DNA adenine methylase
VYNIIRYPGSKAKIWSFILRHSPPSISYGGMFAKQIKCYCEPFVGSGAITHRVLRSIFDVPNASIILNDIDPWISCLWKSVLSSHKELARMVEEKGDLTAEDFYECKRLDGDVTLDPVECAFRKIVLHRSSFSGLGAMAGGPLGGRESNNSDYDPSCRWTPFELVRSIRKAHELLRAFKRVQIHSEDFESTLGRVPNEPSSFAYLDPPYYVQGAALYKHSFAEEDHNRLAATLRQGKYQFVLSYDDCKPIRGLYSWANVKQFNMTPTVQTSKQARRKNSELIVTNF